MSSFRKPVTVLRRTEGHYDDEGYWQDGEEQELTFLASVQPMTAGAAAAYTKMLGEGAFTSATFELYSAVPFLPQKQSIDGNPGQEADIVLWHGKRLKVVQCEPWQNDVINHYHIVAQEIV